MTWDDNKQDSYQVPDNIIDIAFKIDAPILPLDHAAALSAAIQRALPWFASEPQAALHLIYGAASGNGWDRPEGTDALLNLSRRTRLLLRLPKTRLNDAEQLSGQTLDIQNYPLKVGKISHKSLQITEVLFARLIATDENLPEAEFLQHCLNQIKKLGIRCQKAMPGRSQHIKQSTGKPQFCRSLMLADLSSEESIIIQEHGIDNQQKQGMGVFIPHKGIAALN